MAEFVTVTGLKEAANALRALPVALAGKNGGPVRAATYAAGKIIREAAEKKAPRASGNMAANVYIYRDRDPQTRHSAEHYAISVRTRRLAKRIAKLYRGGLLSSKVKTLVGGDAWYWHFVEFGTRKQRAQPFMRSAFEENKHKAVAVFAATLSKRIAWVAKQAKRMGGG